MNGKNVKTMRTNATQVGMIATASEKWDDWLQRVLQRGV